MKKTQKKMKTKYEYKREVSIDYKHVKELREAGWTWDMIAKYYEYSRMQLYRIRKKMGWK
jgi:DNA invertase Pin-like site-specific DNA recombinase